MLSLKPRKVALQTWQLLLMITTCQDPPDRRKRRESIEATMKQISPQRNEEPEVLVVPTPASTIPNPSGNKSRGGKNVKKSKGSLPKKPTLGDIPEVVVTTPTPKDITDHSPRSGAPSPETDEELEG